MNLLEQLMTSFSEISEKVSPPRSILNYKTQERWWNVK